MNTTTAERPYGGASVCLDKPAVAVTSARIWREYEMRHRPVRYVGVNHDRAPLVARAVVYASPLGGGAEEVIELRGRA